MMETLAPVSWAWRSMPGKKALVMRNMLLTFRSKLRSQSSSLQSSRLPLATMPAQLKRASSGPSRAASASTAAPSRTSSCSVCIVGAVWASVASKAALMSVATTRAPSAAQARALARPMPWAAAVISTVLPCNRPCAMVWTSL